MSIEQGDIFKFDFGPRQNSLMEGPHFVVVIQTDELNKLQNYHSVVVAPITSKHRASPTYVQVLPSTATQLIVPSYVVTNQIFTIDKGQLGDPAGKTTEFERTLVKRGLATVFDIVKDNLSP